MLLLVTTSGIPPHVMFVHTNMQELKEPDREVSDGLPAKIIECLGHGLMGGVLSETRIRDLFHAPELVLWCEGMLVNFVPHTAGWEGTAIRI
jgi:hypothetical protein